MNNLIKTTLAGMLVGVTGASMLHSIATHQSMIYVIAETVGMLAGITVLVTVFREHQTLNPKK